MNKKKLLIFDLDGTLINTVKDLNVATNYALEKLGYPLRTVKNTTDDIGNGVAKLIERSIPAISLDSCIIVKGYDVNASS